MTSDPGTDPQRRAAALFDELVELSAAERAPRLAALDLADAAAAREVRALLAADAAAGGFLSAPLADAQPTLLDAAMQAQLGASGAGEDGGGGAAPAFSSGDRIGAWRMVRPVGAGGMGEVWEVERAEGDFQQRAALKLLKRGLDSEDLLRRFRAERQIQARLRHPAIAHLYDGGIAPDGRPYYVMELVAGQPLTDAATARNLSIDDRLALFLTVCDAVDAAHRALVVHRDLKPSNVLVTEAGAVKLLDFGIAKVLEQDDADGGTRAWERVMTPAYAAPEQILGEPVTTATDVYALGVLLFELLTGRLPHRRSALSAAKLIEEVTRETVERPSTVVLGAAPESGAAVAVDAAERELRQRRARRLRGDLDWIVLRALAREPERRYASASALAADLRRHLDGHPVEARPDSLGYRASRFVRRNRIAVAAAALVALALVGGAGLALWQAREARAQAARAEQESTRARAEAERARREATRSERIADFLKTMILEANPTARSGAESPTLVEVVKAGAANVEAALEGEPELQARMGIFFGDLFMSLNDHDQAKPILERAYEIATTQPGVEPRTVVDAHGSLGNLRYEERDLATAERLYRTGLARAAKLLENAPEDRALLELQAILHTLLSITVADGGRAAEAIAAAETALRIQERLHGPESLEVVINATNLGMMQERMGRLEAAEVNLRRAFDTHRKLFGEHDPRLYFVGEPLGDVLLARGDFDGARSYYASALAAARAGFGEDDRRVVMALYSLAEVPLAQGRLDEAERALREAEARARAVDDDRALALVLQSLGDVAMARRQPRQAIAGYAAAHQVSVRHWGVDHHAPNAIAVRAALARVDAGEAAAVVPELERLVALQREGSLGAAEVVAALRALGVALAASGRPADALVPLREAVTLGERELTRERLPTVLADLELGTRLASGADPAARQEGRERVASAIARLDALGRGWLPEVERARAATAS